MQIIKIGKNKIERDIEVSSNIEERKNNMLEMIKNPITCRICETIIKADAKDLIMIGDGYSYYEEYIKCPNCDSDITYMDILYSRM